MSEAIKELDVVEFLEDIPETIAKKGFTGTVVYDYCSVLGVVEVELGQEHEYELVTANKSKLKLIWSCPEEEKEIKQQELVDRDTNNLVWEKIIDTAYTAAIERIKEELDAQT